MLDDRDRAYLDFEADWWGYTWNKERAILAEFGHGATTYYARLNRLLDDPEALAYAPQLVKRLRRVREGRLAARRRPLATLVATAGPSK